MLVYTVMYLSKVWTCTVPVCKIYNMKIRFYFEFYDALLFLHINVL